MMAGRVVTSAVLHSDLCLSLKACGDPCCCVDSQLGRCWGVGLHCRLPGIPQGPSGGLRASWRCWQHVLAAAADSLMKPHCRLLYIPDMCDRWRCCGCRSPLLSPTSLVVVQINVNWLLQSEHVANYQDATTTSYTFDACYI